MEINVAIIMGGYSLENHISEKSGKVVFENLNNIFKCYNIYITNEEWYYIVDGKLQWWGSAKRGLYQ